MTNIKKKDTINITNTGETTIDNELELKLTLTKIHGTLKEDISEDYTKAKINEQKIEPIIELVQDAYYARTLMKRIEQKATEWKYNHKTQTWKEIILPKTKKEIIKQQSDTLFGMIMIRANMIAILHRNTENNPLIRLQAGAEETNNIKEEEQETEKTANIIRKALKKEEK